MRLLYAVLFLLSVKATAQETGVLLGYDYSNVYNSTSASLTRNKADFEIKNKALKISGGVAAYGIDTNNNISYSAGTQNITALYAALSYTHAINSAWAAVAELKPTLVSDLKNPAIKDVYPGFFAGFTYKPSSTAATTLTFGAGYNGYFSKYRFIPMINLSGNITERASYNIGIPATWIAYKIAPQHSVKAFVTADGLYSRYSVAAATTVYNTTPANTKSLEMVTINSGLEYGFVSGNEWMALIKAGYSIYNELNMPQSAGGESIRFENNLYLAAGFKYNLKL